MDLALSLGLGGWGVPIENTPLPSGPSAITDWSVAPGSEDGEADITISTLPDAGDGADVGDGLGTITGLQWQPEGYGVWFDLPAATTGTYTVGTPLLQGETVNIVVRALGYLGREGVPSTPESVTVTGAAVDLLAVYSDDEHPVYSDDEKAVYVAVESV